jgi:hypothetical protein
VPVWVRNGGVISNFGSIAVAASGQQACSDTFGFSASDLEKVAEGGTVKLGLIEVGQETNQTQVADGITAGVRGHRVLKAAHQLAATTTTTGNAAAEFFAWGNNILESQGLGVPAVGSCTVSVAIGDTVPSDPIKATPLNAGPSVEIKGGPTSTTVQLTPITEVPGFYGTSSTLPSGFGGAGTYTADNGSGGPDVPAFNVSATFGTPLVWTNQSSITNVTRSDGVTVTWTGGNAGDYVEIFGTSLAIDASDTFLAYASFKCLANQSDLKFTVPSSVLLSLSATSSDIIALPGTLIVSDFAFQKIVMSGVDEAFFIDSSQNEAEVIYQ